MTTTPTCPVKWTGQKAISTIAYECIPGLIFVRDPSLRGRYLLTDRCVAERACPLCHSAIGEPCKSRNNYGVNVHVARKGGGWKRIANRTLPKPKPHIAAEDLEEAQRTIEHEPEIVASAWYPRAPLVTAKHDWLSLRELLAATDMSHADLVKFLAEQDVQTRVCVQAKVNRQDYGPRFKNSARKWVNAAQFRNRWENTSADPT